MQMRQAHVSPVPGQMREGRAQSRCKCGRGEPSPGADLSGVSPPAASAAKIGHAAAAAHPEMQRAVADGPHNIGKKHAPETDGVEPAQLLLQSCNSDHCANTPSCNEAPRAHAAEKLPLRSLHAAGGALQQAMQRCVVRVPVDRLRHIRAVVGDADAAAAHRHGSERYGVPCCIGLHAIWDTTLCRTGHACGSIRAATWHGSPRSGRPGSCRLRLHANVAQSSPRQS